MMLRSQASDLEGAPQLALSRARPLLGTLVQIKASGAAAHLPGAIDAAFRTIERLHHLLSYQEPYSELSLLNRQALHEPRQVDPDTYAVLSAALQFAQLSDGAFDPCVASDLVRWGVLPTQALWGAGARETSGSWRDIDLLSDRRVCLRRPLQLDLSGIAKGYAVDRAVEVLRDAGADQILVNAGGDLRCVGPCAQDIWLRHPSAPGQAMHRIRLQDAALATSGAYYSRQPGPSGEVSALVNPARHAPHLASGSVSVRARNCRSADALTKVVLFAPPALAERALAACDAVAFVHPPDPSLLENGSAPHRLPPRLAAHAP